MPDIMDGADGGPAFPMAVTIDNYVNRRYSGLSVRDHFAGLAMQALMSTSDTNNSITRILVAQRAYEIADAMLEERKA